MQALLTPPISKRPENCDYYTLDGELITSNGLVVADWLSPFNLYMDYDGLSSVESAHVVTSVVTDFCKWCSSPQMAGYNAVAVCHVSTAECLIAPCYWCADDEQTAKYLAMETPEGSYERINVNTNNA
jgi:hypothetical protein